MDSAVVAMRRELKVAGVPEPAAGVLARMHVPLGMLLRKDLAWAVSCLAEKGVTLSGREQEQLELAISQARWALREQTATYR